MNQVNKIKTQANMFIQLEDRNDGDIRYVFVGTVNNKGQATGLVHGYEGGGVYSEMFIVNDAYIPNTDLQDNDIEWEKQASIFEDMTDMTEKECWNMFESMLTYDNEGCNWSIKDEANRTTEMVFSEFNENFIPPSYANTYWAVDNTTLMEIKDIEDMVQ